jgi:DNA-binding CsgD family transcriptional regulator
MQHIVLWIGILAMAALFAGLGAEFLAYLRRRESWRSLYMVSILIYELLLLVQTFTYFDLHYLSEPIAGLPLFAGYFRSIVSLLLIIALPHCIAKASGMRPGRAGGFLLFLPAILTFAGIAVSLSGLSQWVPVVLNIAFNAFIAAISIIGAIRVVRGLSGAPRSEVLPFLAMSAVSYAVFVALALVMVAGALPLLDPDIGPFVNGLFCLSWGLLLIVSAVRRAVPPRGLPGALSPRFVADYSLSQREAEVAAHLVAGLTNREIGERLFISPRTVETHVYNAYRKSGCRNKAELINKVHGYDPGIGAGRA